MREKRVLPLGISNTNGAVTLPDFKLKVILTNWYKVIAAFGSLWNRPRSGSVNWILGLRE